MYRLTMIIVAVLALVSVPAFAQEGELGFYHQSLVSDGEVTPRFFLEGYHSVMESAGAWGFGYYERDYLSAVAGPYADLFEVAGATFSVGAGGGAAFYPDEQGNWGLEGRYAAYVELSGEGFVLEFYYENGASGEDWHLGLAEVEVSPLFSVGAVAQKGDGIGPRLAIHPPRTPLNVWVAPMFSSEGSRRLLIGAEIVFSR